MYRVAMLTLVATMLALAMAQPSAAASGASCTSSKAYCVPDGRAPVVVYGGSPCDWTAKINWGDGRKQSYHYSGGQHTVWHRYKRRGFYKETVAVSGKPDPGQNVHCGGGKGSTVFEYPFTAAQIAVLRGVRKLAHQVRKPARNLGKVYKKIKKQGGAKAPKSLLQKANELERRLLGDLAKRAKEEARKWAIAKLQKEFTKKFSAAVGVGQKTLKKLWGFVGALGQLNQFPKAAVEAADKLYVKDSDFHGDMDALANLAGCTNGIYGNCTVQQKRYMDVEFSITIRTGAVKQLINDAAEAGKAGATVSFSLPGE
jgi:hypothetical protein